MTHIGKGALVRSSPLMPVWGKHDADVDIGTKQVTRSTVFLKNVVLHGSESDNTV